MSSPAIAFGFRSFTVITTSSKSCSPLLSVTTSLAVYIPLSKYICVGFSSVESISLFVIKSPSESEKISKSHLKVMVSPMSGS